MLLGFCPPVQRRVLERAFFSLIACLPVCFGGRALAIFEFPIKSRPGWVITVLNLLDGIAH